MYKINSDFLLLLGRDLLILVAAVIIAKLLQVLILKLIIRSKKLFDISEKDINRISRPILFLSLLFFISTAFNFIHLSEIWLKYLNIFISILSVASFGLLVISIINILLDKLQKRHADQTLSSRRFNTQIIVMRKIALIVVAVLTLIGIAVAIPGLREIGMSLFASAGVAGIIVGIAAKSTFSNLIAGVQLALSQQILLGDEVIVENQFGTIEEITSNYVVVKLWDLRRLVVPLNYFMENPFENWTYKETDMFGTVNIYIDYTLDVDAVRSEAKRIAKQSELWDGKRCDLVVVNSKEMVMELRITVSAKNSSDLWLLRCDMREKLIKYLQEKQPDALPRTRVNVVQKT